MNFQEAIERAIKLRLRAKNEIEKDKRQTLLDLAQKWEAWAEHCRERTAKGEAIDPAGKPADDI